MKYMKITQGLKTRINGEINRKQSICIDYGDSDSNVILDDYEKVV